MGERVGIPWLGYTCGRCDYCDRDRENLCDHAAFTGFQNFILEAGLGNDDAFASLVLFQERGGSRLIRRGQLCLRSLLLGDHLLLEGLHFCGDLFLGHASGLAGSTVAETGDECVDINRHAILGHALPEPESHTIAETLFAGIQGCLGRCSHGRFGSR